MVRARWGRNLQHNIILVLSIILLCVVGVNFVQNVEAKIAICFAAVLVVLLKELTLIAAKKSTREKHRHMATMEYTVYLILTIFILSANTYGLITLADKSMTNKLALEIETNIEFQESKIQAQVVVQRNTQYQRDRDVAMGMSSSALNKKYAIIQKFILTDIEKSQKIISELQKSLAISISMYYEDNVLLTTVARFMNMNPASIIAMLSMLAIVLAELLLYITSGNYLLFANSLVESIHLIKDISRKEFVLYTSQLMHETTNRVNGDVTISENTKLSIEKCRRIRKFLKIIYWKDQPILGPTKGASMEHAQIMKISLNFFDIAMHKLQEMSL
jgi:hypothetical protein